MFVAWARAWSGFEVYRDPPRSPRLLGDGNAVLLDLDERVGDAVHSGPVKEILAVFMLC